MIESIILPFYNDELYEGLGTVEGVMRFENEQLILEFQIADNILKIIKSDASKTVLMLSELNSVEYKKTLFNSKFKINSTIFLAAKNVPLSKGAEVEFKIKRKHSELAQSLASGINLRIAEYKLNKIESSN
jgi:hypothetical protein